MTTLYYVPRDFTNERYYPCIQRILRGIPEKTPCLACGGPRRRPAGDLLVKLAGNVDPAKWPDVLLTGDYPVFVVSDRFIRVMRECGIRLVFGGRIEFDDHPPSGVRLRHPVPAYYWLDGPGHLAGTMGLEASGFVEAGFCPDCGRFLSDVAQTNRRQEALGSDKRVIQFDETLGLDLFTTNQSPTAYYCTDRFRRCADRHKLSGISFKIACEDNVGAGPAPTDGTEQ